MVHLTLRLLWAKHGLRVYLEPRMHTPEVHLITPVLHVETDALGETLLTAPICIPSFLSVSQLRTDGLCCVDNETLVD